MASVVTPLDQPSNYKDSQARVDRQKQHDILQKSTTLYVRLCSIVLITRALILLPTDRQPQLLHDRGTNPRRVLKMRQPRRWWWCKTHHHGSRPSHSVCLLYGRSSSMAYTSWLWVGHPVGFALLSSILMQKHLRVCDMYQAPNLTSVSSVATWTSDTGKVGSSAVARAVARYVLPLTSLRHVRQCDALGSRRASTRL